MLRIMFQKLFSKKWMNMCLLLGSILLIATVVSFPLYQTAAYDRMLQDEFKNYVSENGTWPAANSFLSVSKNDYEGQIVKKMEGLLNSLNSEIGVSTKENIYYYVQSAKPGKSEWGRDDLQNLSVMTGCLSNLDKHAKMISGEMYSETGRTEDGAIEVVVSEAGLVGLKLLVGETIQVEGIKDLDGKNIRIYVKGVFAKADSTDFYWQVNPDDMSSVVLMNENVFHDIFFGENVAKYSITCRYYSLFNYEDIKANDVKHIREYTDYLTNESPYRQVVDKPAYTSILEEYGRKLDRIKATLLILQIPVLVMLAAFLFMISTQMYDMEKNEISVIKSRGSSGAQIFRLYLYQCLFISIVGAGLGIPLGGAFARVLGSSKDFLEFGSGRNLVLSYNNETWIYAISAVVVTLLIMTLPAIKHSRVTIVKLKQSKAVKSKSWWEKIFLDVIILGVSLYGYYSFNKSANVAENVLSGESLDPLLYMSSSLFIVGAGLLFLRLQPYIIQLIYICGKRFWKPASYTSFMENIKNGRKQQFIMLFLIMTISLGMYHATVARTILKNAEANINYLDAVDIVIKEGWSEIKDSNGNPTGNYSEPDYTKYARIEAADKFTKVIYDTKAHVNGSKTGGRVTITAEGIHTKQFGELTWLDKKFNGKHYYEILNDLAADQKGVILTENFKTKFGFEVGDNFTYYANGNKEVSAKIVDFVSYWPGYAPTSTVLNPDGTVETNDNFLVIANYDYLVQKIGQCPYEIWMQLKDGYSSKDISNWINEQNIHVTKYVDKSADVRATMEDPLLQGTNGVLTMGFIVTILLCAVGYLIYWIMSIKSRELIFGVLRACGLHKREMLHMLFNEQIFSGVFSIAAGIGIGRLTSVMFVPMLQQAYASTNQVLPMELVMNSQDMMRLYAVIFAAMLLCLIVLVILIFKMNVTKALKLGEE